MMLRKIRRTIGAVAACAVGLTTVVAHADDPVLSGSYGWEDGVGTMLGSFGNLLDPINTGPVDGVTPNSGNRMLRVTEGEPSSTPQVFVAFIENLQDGDVIDVSAMLYDDVPDSSYRARLWAHYAQSGDPTSFAGSAGGPSNFTTGIGWEESSYSWTFDSDGGTRDSLMIEVRLYTNIENSHFYIDDVSVDVFCAANPDLTITFPDNLPIGDPAEPGPECQPPKPCEPFSLGEYGWEDEIATAFNTTGNITEIENTGPINGIAPNTGDRMLRMQQGSTSGTPQVWVAFIENLSDGDEVFVSMFTHDVTSGGPSVRLWAHGAISGDPTSVVGQMGGEHQNYPNGTGWEELNEEWIFDSNGGSRDAMMIQVRLYAAEENDEFYVDDIHVEVCSDNPNVRVTFPDKLGPPLEPCDVPNGTPDVEATFDWEDGTSTILGYDNDKIENVEDANVTAPAPVHSGDRALRVTEAPHEGTPKIFLAYIEHLEDGDTIHGRFHAFDDTPGSNPMVRIWGRRVFSGDINSLPQSLGGNDDGSSGEGWEELCHTWEFDGGTQGRDAMVIEARIYSDPATCGKCSTDYFIDDMEVMVWSENATITLPDGSVIGEPPMLCPADINASGIVDEFDLFTVLGAWGTSDPDADINHDQVVDGGDLGVLLASWGVCTTPYLAPAEGNVNLVVETAALRSGMNRHDIYVQLGAGDELVNVYDANVEFSGSFDSSSYIAIGADDAAVIPDPSFDAFEFAFGIGMGENAGWYNEDPDNDLGLADLYPNHQVLIASLTMDKVESAAGTLSVTFEDADGRPIHATASFDTEDVGTCEGDLNGDSTVDVSDLLSLLSSWGACPGCGADLNGDDVVDVSDLLSLLSAWGACR